MIDGIYLTIAYWVPIVFLVWFCIFLTICAANWLTKG